MECSIVKEPSDWCAASPALFQLLYARSCNLPRLVDGAEMGNERVFMFTDLTSAK